MLDFVAQRYGVLPSTLMATGSSFDVLVADLAQRYHNRAAEAARAGKKTPPPVRDASQAEMMAMVQKIKAKRNASKDR